MNGKKFSLGLIMILSHYLTAGAADGPEALVEQGNQAYQQGDYPAAIDQYDKALIEMPQATQPKYNKANSYYRLDDLDKAIDLYKEVSSEAKDMTLVEKARYNLGNCLFQEGMKQRDANLQQAVDDLKAAIGQWRRTLEINQDNPKAACNIEVARLVIKDIMDQINQQQQNDPNQAQDPNQTQNQQQQQQSQQNQTQDPNQPGHNADPNESDNAANQDQQPSDQSQQQDPNQSPEPQRQSTQQKPMEQDMTAQAILDKEQRQKQQRRMRQRAGYQRVDKDW